MVPVQKDERLLAQHDEQRVAQLGHFGQHEHGGPEAGHLVIFDVTAKQIIIISNLNSNLLNSLDSSS